VPTVPAWTVTDLVEHLGQTQHWVATIIERRITDPTAAAHGGGRTSD
jgi:Mycothiol maleylpyruvate isomerase N-terminal domain